MSEISVRPMREDDLAAADRIRRLAFGTFLGAPDPTQMFGDVDHVYSRFAAEPSWAFVAERDGEVVGSNFAVRWGSYGFFGPLSVHPELWDAGVGGLLVEPVVELFDQWGLSQSGLYTFPHSPKHIGLYRKFGFWPQYLTPIMSKASARFDVSYTTFSQVAAYERELVLDECAELTGEIFAGLDLGHEIRYTAAQALGDTVLLRSGSTLAAFAVCHINAGEAGSDAAYVKFGAARPSAGAAEAFEQLLAACEDLAHARGASTLTAGVNAAREDACRRMLARGYRATMNGVILQRPNAPGYCRPDVYVVDDLR
jgi:GNAT superfamily N-acetyltransferase